MLVPYLVGERTPNLPHAKASLHGVTARSFTREHLARAEIEGMLCALADGVDALAQVGVPVERIVLVGGAAGNEAVRAVAQTVFEVPVSIPEPGEYVALGAAAQAARAAAALAGRNQRRTLTCDVLTPSPHPGVRAAYASPARSYRTDVTTAPTV